MYVLYCNSIAEEEVDEYAEEEARDRDTFTRKRAQRANVQDGGQGPERVGAFFSQVDNHDVPLRYGKVLYFHSLPYRVDA